MIRIWLFFLAVLLFACSSVGPQGVPVTQVSPSSVQHPGVSMGFELKIFNPTGATLKATYTEASPGGLVDRFEWRVSGDGNCIELTFYGRPDRLDVADLDIVQFRLVNVKYAVDGSNMSDTVFTGQVIDKPDNRAKRKQVYRVVGLKDWLRLVRQELNVPDQLITTTVSSLKALLPSFISGQAATVGSGFGSRPFALGSTPMRFAFDDLAKSAIVPSGQKPVTWGLDRFGRLFFKRPTDSVTVPFSAILFNREDLRIQSTNVVTAATLVLGQSDPGDGKGEEYRKPHAITYRIENTAHATYQRETVQSVSNVVFEIAPDTVDAYRGTDFMADQLMVGRTSVYGPYIGRTDYFNGKLWSSAIDQANVDLMDDDPATFSNIPTNFGGSGPLDRRTLLIEAKAPSGYIAIGARWNIDSPGSDAQAPDYLKNFLVLVGSPSNVDLNAIALGVSPNTNQRVPGNYVGSAVLWGKGSALNPALYTSVVQFWISTPLTDSAGFDVQVRVRTLKLICVKMDVLEQAAKSLIKLPSAVVEKVEIPGAYLYPFSVLSISGAPGGTITGDATEYSYSYSATTGLKTMVSIGSSDASEAAQVMKLMAQDLDAAVGTSARVYSDRR